MKIHSDVLTERDVRDAAQKAGVTLTECRERGSRSRARTFVFYLSGSSPYWSNSGNCGASHNYRAATWDEWGIALAHMFDVDPFAHTGKNSYQSAEHFHWTTGERFRTLTPSEQHVQHRYDYKGRSAGGAYHVQACKCGAVTRHLASGYTFDMLTEV